MRSQVILGNASSKITRRSQQSASTDEWPCSSILKSVFLGRGVNEPSLLDYSLSKLRTPDTFKDKLEATAVVIDAIVQGKSILILGDYDTDGATAVSLGILSMREMGVSRIDYLVPNRFDYGYGLSPEIAKVAIGRAPDLVITVDNGINSVDGVAALREAGIKVLITDHHLPGETLPNANAILNPNQVGCDFPEKSLAGVGVMFYLMLMVRAQLRKIGWFEDNDLPVPNLAQYLDLVALGTVADLVKLEYNNRILVDQGIKRIRSGQCRPGIIALMEVAGRNFHSVVASDLGFAVAPRLNAAGRLEDISLGIECLLCDEGQTARIYAAQLDEINQQRRSLEQEMQNQAIHIVNKLEEQHTSSNEHQDIAGLCLFDPGWHQGITGLVASRIKDRTGKPVIAFAEAAENNLTGSARSVSGLHIRDLLEEINTSHSGLIEKFGGHAMAAGLTLNRDHLDEFKHAFENAVSRHFVKIGRSTELVTDGVLSTMDIEINLAEEIRAIAPWGQGFPIPLFEGRFTVLESRLVGEIHLKMTLLCEQTGKQFDAIAFRAISRNDPAPVLDQADIIFQLDINEFRGKRKLQLIVVDIQVVEQD